LVFPRMAKKFCTAREQGWFIAKTDAAPKPGDGALKLDEMEVFVDPRAEWNQMYHEVVWRIEARFPLRPAPSRAGPQCRRKKIRALSEGPSRRGDLNYLFDEMLGEITIGHMFIGGGDFPNQRKLKGRIAWRRL